MDVGVSVLRCAAGMLACLLHAVMGRNAGEVLEDGQGTDTGMGHACRGSEKTTLRGSPARRVVHPYAIASSSDMAWRTDSILSFPFLLSSPLSVSCRLQTGARATISALPPTYHFNMIGAHPPPLENGLSLFPFFLLLCLHLRSHTGGVPWT